MRGEMFGALSDALDTDRGGKPVKNSTVCTRKWVPEPMKVAPTTMHPSLRPGSSSGSSHVEVRPYSLGRCCCTHRAVLLLMFGSVFPHRSGGHKRLQLL